MIRFLLLGSNRVIRKYVVEDGFLSDRLFPSGQRFLSFDDLPAKPLELISMAFQSLTTEADPLELDKSPHLGQNSLHNPIRHRLRQRHQEAKLLK